MNYLEEARTLQDKIVANRRYLHMYPELSGKETATADFIAEKLRQLGLEVTTGIGAPMPGVVGVLRGSKTGKTVALRADMDALGLMEQCDSAFRSKNDGVMHACGHDAHMAILLGAAELLAAHRSELNGTVKFIFQPSEEFGGGAVPMIVDGVLDNPEVDAIFGLHMDPSYQVGEIAVSYGETLAAADRLVIKIKGKSAHGATPHLGVDPVVVAAHAIIAMQTVISRERDPLDAAVLSFGIIQGGHQQNVIADEVMLSGILRTLNPVVREETIKNIQLVLDGIAVAFKTTCELTRNRSYDSLINDNRMVDFVKEIAGNLLGESNVRQLPKPRLIVEDFAYYLQKKPGAFFFLGCGNTAKGITQPLHSSLFELDEEALLIGTAIQAALVTNFLQQGVE